MENDKTVTLFIIEDNVLYATALKQFLQTKLERFNRYVSIQNFKTGESCIEALDENCKIKPDVIILDYFLDNQFSDAMNGLSALFFLKIFNPEVEVVFLSSQDKTEVTIETLRFGAFDYIVKDEFAFENVLSSVRECLNGTRLSYRINQETREEAILNNWFEKRRMK